MDRRLFLGGFCAAAMAGPAVADALPVPPGGRIAFAVFRNGRQVGEHDISFARDGDDLTVETNLAFTVTIAAIPVYTYTLFATEKWSDGVFQRVDSVVNNNGTQIEVHAHKIATGYDVKSINHTHPEKTYPEYTAPPNTIPLTYWNKAMLNGTVLNVATAHSYPPIVSSPGWNNVPTATDGTILAQRFDVTGKLHLSVWYDRMAQWAGLQFHLKGDWNYAKII
jgi:hypothetical protein